MHLFGYLKLKYLTGNTWNKFYLKNEKTKREHTFAIRGRSVPSPLMCTQEECLSHKQVALVTAVQDGHSRRKPGYVSTSVVSMGDPKWTLTAYKSLDINVEGCLV